MRARTSCLKCLFEVITCPWVLPAVRPTLTVPPTTPSGHGSDDELGRGHASPSLPVQTAWTPGRPGSTRWHRVPATYAHPPESRTSRRSTALSLLAVVALLATLLPVSADARPAPFVTGGGWIEVPGAGVVGGADGPSMRLNTGFVARSAGTSARGNTTARLRTPPLGLQAR